MWGRFWRRRPRKHTGNLYKLRNPKPSVDQKLTDPALTGAIDLHAHFGPDSYARQWDAFEVVKLAKERGMRGVVLKNHWTESAGLAWLIRKVRNPGGRSLRQRHARHARRRRESHGGPLHG